MKSSMGLRPYLSCRHGFKNPETKCLISAATCKCGSHPQQAARAIFIRRIDCPDPVSERFIVSIIAVEGGGDGPLGAAAASVAVAVAIG